MSYMYNILFSSSNNNNDYYYFIVIIIYNHNIFGQFFAALQTSIPTSFVRKNAIRFFPKSFSPT